jgi:hypothetical protein
VGERSGVCRVFIGKPELKRSLLRPRLKWEDIIKMDLQGKQGVVDWIDLAQEWQGGGFL